MESPEKADIIRRWIDPEERVTVDFENERDLNAEVIEMRWANCHPIIGDRVSPL